MSNSTPALPLYVLRNGLPRLGRKLRAGQPVTIAYLGGSITQAYPDGYASQTTAWFRQRYPDVQVTEVNAGIGGTGSNFGAFRLRQDVLVHRPDLLLVEFAVNDSEEGYPVQAALEGIIRRTLRELGESCEIALIYTMKQTFLDDLKAGRLPPGARLHDPIAEHYGLPTINVALDIARRLLDGRLVWPDFSGDSCHPGVPGHRLYATVLAEALTAAFDVPPSGAARLPAPLTPDPWEFADMKAIAPHIAFPGWTYRPLKNNGGWQCFDGLFECDRPGLEAEFKFDGRAVGLFYQLGPETGDLLWAVDKGPWAPVRLFDDYSDKFWRPSIHVLTSELAPGRHRLRVQVGPDRDPRSKGNQARLAGILMY